MSGVVVRTATGEADREACFGIRVAVFVRAGRSAARGADKHDATATHLLAVEDGRPLGTSAWRVPGAQPRSSGWRCCARHAASAWAVDGPGPGHDPGAAGLRSGGCSMPRRRPPTSPAPGLRPRGRAVRRAGIEHIRMRRNRYSRNESRAGLTPSASRGASRGARKSNDARVVLADRVLNRTARPQDRTPAGDAVWPSRIPKAPMRSKASK